MEQETVIWMAKKKKQKEMEFARVISIVESSIENFVEVEGIYLYPN